MAYTSKLLHAYLTSRDGAIAREGRAMLRLANTTGYSVEALRSFAYGRRSPQPCPRRAKLLKAIRRG